MSSKNSPSLHLKPEETSFAAKTENETKSNTSYFSVPFIASTFANIAYAVINFVKSIPALLYGAAQYFSFFQDTNAENLSGASTPAVMPVAQDKLANPSPTSTDSYGSVHDLLTPVPAPAPAAVPTTPPTTPAAALKKHDSVSSLDADDSMFHDVDSDQEVEEEHQTRNSM